MADKPTCIHHSPPRKIALRQELYAIVYERTLERFNETLGAIRQKNTALMVTGYDGFTYQGVYYGMTIDPRWPKSTQYAIRKGRLDDSLAPAMDQLLEERRKVEQVEGVMVMSTLGTVLNAAQHIEDYKRLLPQLLHNHLDQVATECDCQVPRLSDEEINAVLAKHGKYINKIRQRQVIYLLQP